MFHLRRRKQESYWHLSDSFDSKDGGSFSDYDGGPMGLNQQDDRVKDVFPPCTNMLADSDTSENNMSLEYAMALQNKWTSWPNTIWETNYEDADAEIVFSDDGSGLENDGSDLGDPGHELSSRKSEGTVDTDDETTPSCSSPSTWELEDLDLSAIVDDESSDHDIFESHQNFLEDQPESDWKTCSTCHRKDDLCMDSSRKAFSQNIADSRNDSHSHYFVIEEAFERSFPQPLAFFSPKRKRQKRLRFADEEGKEMETVHFVDCDEYEDPGYRRVLILLLLPKQRKYEFVHAEYCVESQLTVSQLLNMLSGLASDAQIRKQQYSGLCRAAGGNELSNSVSIQSFDLSSDEILLGIPNGYSGEAMCGMARALVQNEKILRAVKKTQRWEHTLHILESESKSSLGKRSPCTSIDRKQGLSVTYSYYVTNEGAGEVEKSHNLDTTDQQHGLFRRIAPKRPNGGEGFKEPKRSNLFRKPIFQRRKQDGYQEEQSNPSWTEDIQITERHLLQRFSPQLRKLQSPSDNEDATVARNPLLGSGSNRNWAKRRWNKLRSIGTVMKETLHA